MKDLIKIEFRDFPLNEILNSPPLILHGVSKAENDALIKLGIHTIFDLAFSPFFRIAQEIKRACNDNQHPIKSHGLLPSGFIQGLQSDLPVYELVLQKIEHIAGIDASIAASFTIETGIETIDDLASWPPFLVSQKITNLELQEDVNAVQEYTAPELVPKFGDHATEIAYYKKIVTIGQSQGSFTDLDKPVDILSINNQMTAKPYLGAQITFSQTWTSDAITLGRLVNSLSLAPGETTKIAVIDWIRKSRTSSDDSAIQNESLDNSLTQSSIVEEVTNSVASEVQSGASESKTASMSYTAAAAGAAWSPVAAGAAGHSLALNGSSALSTSSSEGRKDMLASFSQDIDRSTQQKSTSSRSKRSVYVTEATQEEREEINTRSVTNYNHMHTLNVLYFEVVQLYRVQLSYHSAERVLFVPMQPIKFDLKALDRFRSILVGAALTNSIRSGLLNNHGTVSATLQALHINKIRSELNLFDAAATPPRFVTKQEDIKRAKEAMKYSSYMKAMFITSSSIKSAVTAVSANQTEWELAGDSKIIHIGWDAHVESAEIQTENGEKILIKTNAGINRLQPTISRELRNGISALELSSVTLKVTAADRPRPLKVNLYFTTATDDTFTVPCWCVVAPRQTIINLVSFDTYDYTKDVLRHLNEHALYYSQQIWMTLDQQTLAAALSPFTFNGKRLLDYIDQTPIGVHGSHLAFIFPDETDQTWTEWVKKKITKSHLSSQLIALPTGGVFSEGVLGRSNCAEKLDMTRFWNWQDSPPPIQAPDIAAIQAGQHTVENAQRSSGLEPSVVNIMNPQNLPDPTGVGAIVSAMSSGGMFRDMSGLSGNQNLAAANLQATSALAGQSLSTVGSLVGSMSSVGSAHAPSLGSSVNPASALSAGLERRLSPMTANPTTSGALINLARDMDLAEKSDATNSRQRNNRSSAGTTEFAAFHAITPNSGEVFSQQNSNNISKPLPSRIQESLIRGERMARIINDALQINTPWTGELLLTDFAIGKSDLTIDNKKTLDELITIAHKKDFEILSIEGHASQTGPELPLPSGSFIGNSALARERAEVVAQYLINPDNSAQGVPANKISSNIISDGSLNPITDSKGKELGINRAVLIKYKFIQSITSIPNINSELEELTCGIGFSREWEITPLEISSSIEELKIFKNFSDFKDKALKGIKEDIKRLANKLSLKDENDFLSFTFPLIFFRIKNVATGESRVFIFLAAGLSLSADLLSLSSSTNVQKSSSQSCMSAQCATFEDFNTIGVLVDLSGGFMSINKSFVGQILLPGFNLIIPIDISGFNFGIGVGLKLDAKGAIGVLYEIPSTSSFDL